MKCPNCGSEESKVTDSRPVEEDNTIRRRRECLGCGYRFTTYEAIETFTPVVVKKDGTKQFFDKEKLLGGLVKAAEKRPVDAVAIANEIEAELFNSMRREIKSTEIGEMAMDRLKSLDVVAYVRFASVYLEFKDADTFLNELVALKKESK